MIWRVFCLNEFIMVKLKNFLLSLLFPIYCLGCGREGFWICADCFEKLKTENDHSEKKKYNLIIPDLKNVFIAGDYDDSPLLAKAIKKFKYSFISSLGEELAKFINKFWKEEILAKDKFLINNPLVIPIPLSKRRQRWRGFNQSEILAREFSRRFKYDLELCLKRIKHHKPQAELKEAKRLINVKDIFLWAGSDIGGRDVILIDDIITTGATLNEAALILKKAGAKNVYGLTLAKG